MANGSPRKGAKLRPFLSLVWLQTGVGTENRAFLTGGTTLEISGLFTRLGMIRV